jgi:5-formyltetrahydrofolate cyclo-ligase
MNAPKPTQHSTTPLESRDGIEGVRSPGETAAAKAALRVEMRSVLKGINAHQRIQDSLRACALLEKQNVWRRAARVLCYAPRTDELDIAPLIDAALADRKMVALPRFDAETGTYQARRIDCAVSQLPPGYSGIREPSAECPVVPLDQLDLVLVPGLAFSLGGCRLGRGRAFYDRILAGVRGRKCGLGFEEQIRHSIPVESHDVLLDCLVTPLRWCDFHLPEVST